MACTSSTKRCSDFLKSIDEILKFMNCSGRIARLTVSTEKEGVSVQHNLVAKGLK